MMIVTVVIIIMIIRAVRNGDSEDEKLQLKVHVNTLTDIGHTSEKANAKTFHNRPFAMNYL